MFYKVSIFLLTLFVCNSFVSAQNQQVLYKKYAVYFKDKAQSPYSIDNPEAFLSQRALERRAKAQIAIDETDLPVSPSYIKLVLSFGFDYINKGNWSNFIVVGSYDSTLVNKLTELSFVRDVKQVYSHPHSLQNTKKAAGSGLEMGNANGKKASWGNVEEMNYGNSFTQVSMLGVDYMHRKNFLGEGLRIAVLDAGFYKVDELPAFERIRENGQILGTWDFVLNESSVYEDNSHGMSVLSCIAGYVPGELVGTAPQAQFYLLRTEDAATESLVEEYNWEAAAVWADSAGADMINSSLGYTTFDFPGDNHSYADLDGNSTVITKAADRAASKGILVINSAGNSGNSTWRYIGAPADGDSVLAIGAVNGDRQIASFSSRGPSVDGRVKPDICAMGQSTLVALSGGGVGPSNGTSFSGPVLAGAAATLWQANPDATNMQIYHALIQSADRYTNPNADYGYGIPNIGYADLILKNAVGEEYYKNQELTLFPNPNAGDKVMINFFSLQEKKYTIRLSDMQGKTLIQQDSILPAKSMHAIPLQLPDNINDGVYIITLREGKNRFSSKLIIQK